jgi:hypothetical protein
MYIDDQGLLLMDYRSLIESSPAASCLNKELQA